MRPHFPVCDSTDESTKIHNATYFNLLDCSILGSFYGMRRNKYSMLPKHSETMAVETTCGLEKGHVLARREQLPVLFVSKLN
jgi:hypothetical protein